MKKKFSVRDLSYISLFATLIAVSGYINIPLPLSTVPVTAQTLAVMLAGGLLPPAHAAAAVLVFLMMGAVGIPVFAGGTAGLGIILGKTGGYLVGFLAGAVLISLIKGRRPGFMRLLAVYTAGGLFLVYIFGVLWLAQVTGMDIGKAVVFGAIPFIPGDILKIIIAALLTLKLQSHVRL